MTYIKWNKNAIEIVHFAFPFFGISQHFYSRVIVSKLTVKLEWATKQS